jgi:hypothetical protein
MWGADAPIEENIPIFDAASHVAGASALQLLCPAVVAASAQHHGGRSLRGCANLDGLQRGTLELLPWLI